MSSKWLSFSPVLPKSMDLVPHFRTLAYMHEYFNMYEPCGKECKYDAAYDIEVKLEDLLGYFPVEYEIETRAWGEAGWFSNADYIESKLVPERGLETHPRLSISLEPGHDRFSQMAEFISSFGYVESSGAVWKKTMVKRNRGNWMVENG